MAHLGRSSLKVMVEVGKRGRLRQVLSEWKGLEEGRCEQ